MNRVLTLAIATLFATSCGGDRRDASAVLADNEPIPGELVLSVVSPHPDDGAIVLSILSEVPVEVTAARSDVELFEEGDGPSFKVAVLGHALNGALVRLRVPDIRDPLRYAVAIEQVADERNELRSDLGGYRISLDPEG